MPLDFFLIDLLTYEMMTRRRRLKVDYRPLIKIGAIAGFLIFSGLVLSATAGKRTSSAPCIDRLAEIEMPDQSAYEAQQAITSSKEYLVRRWPESSTEIMVMVTDSEPWMEVFGLLDPVSFSTAKMWLIDPNTSIGRKWISYLDNQNTPRDGFLYLMAEYSPSGPIEECVATRFYSSKITWSGRPQGDFAIIEDIVWRDRERGSGTIFAYQSQDHLPTISVPIEGFMPVKAKAFHTPVY